MNEPTLKQALSEAGYTYERVVEFGVFKGMRVLKDGVQVHDTRILSADGAWELVKEFYLK